MAISLKRQYALSLLVVLLILVAVVQPSVGSPAVNASQEGTSPSAPDEAQPASSPAGQPAPGEAASPGDVTAEVLCTTTGCPAAPSGLDWCVEETDFCVYYDTDSISETQAEWAADIVQMYWDRFVLLGFDEPKHSGQHEPDRNA